jgi:hypothetical protein
LLDDQETEEDFRARVLGHLTGLGVSTAGFRFERVVRLRVGRQVIDVNTQNATLTLVGRYDLLLVNDAGRNVLLAELKRTTEPLTTDDKAQAISYARLQNQMPPLVLLSNGGETRIYDVVSLEEITGEEVSGGWAAFSSGQMLVTADDLLLREEALRLFIGYSQQNVRSFCLAQRNQRMAALRGGPGDRTKKYLPAVYVPRPSVRRAFEAFLASSSPAFVLAGPSGVGKTNELCALAEEASTTHISLFLSATELAEPPAKVLAEEFNWEFSDQLPLPKICDRLASLVAGPGRRVLLFLDAVDECPVPLIEKSVADLAFHFARYEGALKLVVSVKNTQWERFARFGDGHSPLARTCFHGPVTSDASDEAPDGAPSVTLDLMEKADLDVALKKYVACFGVQGEIGGELLGVVRDPFVLRVLCEVCADGAVDVASLAGDQVPLLKRYLDQKLAKVTPAARSSLRLALEAAGRALLEAAKTSGSAEVYAIPERTALAHAPSIGRPELPQEVFDAGLLIREADEMGRARVRFHYDRVRDFVIAYQVLQLDTLTPDQLDANLDRLLQNSLGQAALLTFLDASGEQSPKLLGPAAHRSAQRFLKAYDRIRMQLGPVLRSHISPYTDGAIGLVYSFHNHRWWTHGFFARTLDQPSLVVRPNYRQEWDGLWRGRSDPTVPRTAGLQSSVGWPLLLDPDGLAAVIALEQIRKAVANGGLDETVGDVLDVEKVFAIAGGNRRDLELPRAPWQRPTAYVELAADLLPVDTDLLRRRVHAALGSRQANVEVASRGSDHSEIVAAMKRARDEAMAGRRFDHPDNVIPVPPLAVLSDALDRVHARTPRLEEHYLLLPDSDQAIADPNEARFEDGYSDERLSELIARLCVLRLDEYMRLVEANLPKAGRLLQHYAALPEHLVAFYERPKGGRYFGLSGDLLYARLAVDDPFPIGPGAGLASGRAGKIQVFVRDSEEVPFSSNDDSSWELKVPGGRRILLSNGFGVTSISSFLGQGGNQAPLCWRGERKYYFMPVRNSIYSLLVEDLRELDASVLLRGSRDVE